MLKKNNPFTYIFILIIIVLLSAPFLWNKFGDVVINELYYKDYVLTDKFKINENTDEILSLSFNSDSDANIYVHLIYNDYEKEIIEYTIHPGINNFIVEKNVKPLKNVYIFYIDDTTQHKWILLEM